MCNKWLRGSQMSAAVTFVDEAAIWARELVRGETRFPGDHKPAMRRVARKAGVPHGLIWALHYRVPRTLSVDNWCALGAYYAEQQSRKYAEERTLTTARTAIGRILVGAADLVAGQDTGVVEP